MLIAALACFTKAVLLVAAPIPAPPALQIPSDAPNEALVAAAGGDVGQPFRVADGPRSALSAPLTESALNIVLHGTWRGRAAPAAMISADGAPQRKVTEGEEIVAGVILEEVQEEFVVINNNGMREAVPIENRKVDMGAPARDVLAVVEKSPEPSMAPLRDSGPNVAVAPLTVSAEAEAAHDGRAAETIAAAAPHEPD